MAKSTAPQDELSFKEIMLQLKAWFNYLLSHKIWILALGFGGALLGLILSLVSTPEYIARTTFVVENSKKSSMGDYVSAAAKFGITGLGGGGGGLFQGDDNIMSLLKSRNLITQALYAEGDFPEGKKLIAQKFLELNELDKSWSTHNELKDLRFHPDPAQRTRLEDSVSGLFYQMIVGNYLSVGKPDKEGSIIEVSTLSDDMYFSKNLNDHLLKCVTDFYIMSQTLHLSENVAILQNQTDSIHRILNQALTDVAYGSDATLNMNPAYQRLKVSNQKKIMEMEMNKGILQELVKNLELAKISLRKETPLIQVIDNPIIPLEIVRLRKIKGILIGGIGLGFLAVFVLTLKYYFRRLLS